MGECRLTLYIWFEKQLERRGPGLKSGDTNAQRWAEEEPEEAEKECGELFGEVKRAWGAGYLAQGFLGGSNWPPVLLV